MRFPLDRRLSRRYEARTPWEALVHQHLPDRPIPTTQQDRARLPKAVDAVLLAAPDLPHWPQQLRPKIDVGLARLEAARRPKAPLSVLLGDRWYRAEALVSMARSHQKAWGSLLKKPR